MVATSEQLGVSIPSSKTSFAKASLGKAALLGGGALVVGGAYAADQKFNDGRVTEAVTSPEGYSRAWDHAKEGLSTAWDGVAFVGNGIGDVTTSQQGNPIMMGAAALGMAVLSWNLAPMIIGSLPGLGGDGIISGFARGTLSLGAILALSLAAAGVVGNLKDDSKVSASRPEVTESAVDNQELQAPTQRMDRLVFSP